MVRVDFLFQKNHSNVSSDESLTLAQLERESFFLFDDGQR